MNLSISSIVSEASSKAKKLIKELEHRYIEASRPVVSTHLWEHSKQVANIAIRIGKKAEADLEVVALASLFHDVGKFYSGQYHGDEVREEVHSARIAKEVTSESGLSQDKVERVVEAIYSLYGEEIPTSVEGKVLHDADLLSKSGALGVANFFIKWSTRRMNMTDILVSELGRELSYLENMERLVMTKAAKEIVRKKITFSLDFFNRLTKELSELGILKIGLTRLVYEETPLVIVKLERCDCGGKFILNLGSEDTPTCKRAVITQRCDRCGKEIGTSYCMPLLRSNT